MLLGQVVRSENAWEEDGKDKMKKRKRIWKNWSSTTLLYFSGEAFIGRLGGTADTHTDSKAIDPASDGEKMLSLARLARIFHSNIPASTSNRACPPPTGINYPPNLLLL